MFSKSHVCVHCISQQEDRDNISIQRSPSSLAHSQYLSPISSGISSTDFMELMINLINTLLINDGTSLDDFRNVEEFKEFIHLYLNHLHTQNHNIFSPNVPSCQDKFVIFLSLDAVLRLISINDKGWFSDEIFTFFAKILNLRQEHYPTTKALHVQVPQVIFYNSCDNSSIINPMFKTQPYSIINKLLKK